MRPITPIAPSTSRGSGCSGVTAIGPSVLAGAVVAVGAGRRSADGAQRPPRGHALARWHDERAGRLEGDAHPGGRPAVVEPVLVELVLIELVLVGLGRSSGRVLDALAIEARELGEQ